MARMIKLYVTYREEFGGEVEVEDVGTTAEKVGKAIEQFERGKCKIEVEGELWNEYFDVTDVKTEETLKEMGQ